MCSGFWVLETLARDLKGEGKRRGEKEEGV